MDTIIQMDTIHFVDTPHYCRNDADRIKWLAFKMGMIKVIRPTDTVTYRPERECFELIVVE